MRPHGCNFLKLMQPCSFLVLNVSSGEPLKVSAVISGSVTFCNDHRSALTCYIRHVPCSSMPGKGCCVQAAGHCFLCQLLCMLALRSVCELPPPTQSKSVKSSGLGLPHAEWRMQAAARVCRCIDVLLDELPS